MRTIAGAMGQRCSRRARAGDLWSWHEEQNLEADPQLNDNGQEEDPRLSELIEIVRSRLPADSADSADLSQPDDSSAEAAPKDESRSMDSMEVDDSSVEAAPKDESGDSEDDPAALFEQLHPAMFQHFRNRLSQYSLARLARTQARSSDA